MKTYKIPFINVSFSVGTNAVSPQKGEVKQARKLIPWFSDGVKKHSPDVGFKIGPEIFFRTYKSNSDVRACIRELRENVGLGGYRWVVPNDKEAVPDKKLVDQLDSILKFSGPWRKTLSRGVRDYQIAGSTYFEIIKSIDGKTILGLKVLDPRTMSIVSDPHGEILRYVQNVGPKEIIFYPYEILQVNLDCDPDHEVFGLSPMESVIWETMTDKAAMMSNYYFFENNAKPGANYILETGLTQEQIDSAVDMIESQLKGPENTNRSAVLHGVKEIKSLDVNQKDMEYLLGRRFTTEKVCAAYGVPKFLLGYTDSVNNNNGVQLQKDYYQSTIQPIEIDFQEMVNELVRRCGLADKIAYEWLPQTFDESASIEERALKEYQSGAITLRQYKIKTSQEITDKDEEIENLDKYILFNGSSAVLLEDVGVDPFLDEGNADVAQNLLKELIKTNAQKSK